MEAERIFITASSLADEAMALLEERGCVCEFASGNESAAELVALIGAFRPDALIVRKGQIGEATLAAAERIKAISKHGVGVDRIDVDAATRRGIPVMITPAANSESVAEHALALMLAVVRRVAAQDRQLRRGAWANRDYDGGELRSKTLGLVGYGRIARRLAELVEPFRMEVLAFDPYSTPEGPVEPAATLEGLLERADVVSLHCPLTPDTEGMIGHAELARLKPGAVLVNTARGGLVAEDALIAALREGRLGAAALDTFEQEPPEPDNPLFSMENVVLTSHVGGFSPTSFRNMGVGAVENVFAVLSGRRPDRGSVVNPEVFDEDS